jgi:4-hydroxy-tetrahydrodipicolinate synthase
MSTPAPAASIRSKIGTSAAMLTPFTADGAVDWDRLAAHAARLLGTGMHVVTAFGTTGEGVSIARDERFELYDRLPAAGVAPGQLVECVYGPSAADAGAHVRRSLEAGCAGVLLTPPFYFKGVGDEGVYRWFAEVFEAAGPACRDIILYNIPALTGVTIGAGLAGRLRRGVAELIARINDSAGGWCHTQSLLGEHRDLAVLVGNEGDLARAVRAGASGAISGIANVAPRLVATLVGGTHDPVIDDALRVVLSMPVVPALRTILAAQTGDAAWRRPRAPLVEITDPEQTARCRAVAEILA